MIWHMVSHSSYFRKLKFKDFLTIFFSGSFVLRFKHCSAFTSNVLDHTRSKFLFACNQVLDQHLLKTLSIMTKLHLEICCN